MHCSPRNAPDAIYLVLPIRPHFDGPASQLEAAHIAKRHQFSGWRFTSLTEARSLASSYLTLKLPTARWNVLATWPAELIERRGSVEIAVFPMRARFGSA